MYVDMYLDNVIDKSGRPIFTGSRAETVFWVEKHLDFLSDCYIYVGESRIVMLPSAYFTRYSEPRPEVPAVNLRAKRSSRLFAFYGPLIRVLKRTRTNSDRMG